MLSCEFCEISTSLYTGDECFSQLECCQIFVIPQKKEENSIQEYSYEGTDKAAYKNIHTKVENSIYQGKREVMLLKLFF